jgi:hypothetical protein
MLKYDFIKILSISVLILNLACSKETPTCISVSYPDHYEYPLKPGSQEWIDLGSRNNRALACLIPQDIIMSMSTEGLLETLLNYPFILDFRAFDKMQNGFNMLKSENYGFNELYNRENIYQVFYDGYNSMSLNCEDIYPPIFLGRAAPTSLALSIYEMFIAQEDFLNSLNEETRIKIFILIYHKHLSKIKNKYLESEKQISAAILGRIMYKSNYKPFIDECNNNDFIKIFIDSVPTTRPVDIFPVETIENYAEEFYSNIFHKR